MKKRLLTLILIAIILIPLSVNASKDKKASVKENIYLFYGKECPHCEAEIKFINKLLEDDKYENVNFEKYEVWHNKDNADIKNEIASMLDANGSLVPFLVIGTNVYTGYSDTLSNEIKNTIDYYLGKEYQDPAGDYIHKRDTTNNKYLHYEKKDDTYSVPVLGKVNAKSVSLTLLSIIVGAVDGFNPCAMWILLFLLSLLISTNDRKKMWILGLTFILTSGFIYLLFMLSWLNVAKYTTKIIYVRYLIGIFAFIFGIVNIYRYIKSTKNSDVGCDVTDVNKKRKIMSRIRNILSENKLLFAVLGIMLLAISVNLIELLCSLGLPLMYTEILGLNNLPTLEYAFYIFLYLLFFLIDDLVIFFIAMKTLKIKGISNKYMKYSHLIGGLIMVFVGILMVVKPEWIMLNF